MARSMTPMDEDMQEYYTDQANLKSLFNSSPDKLREMVDAVANKAAGEQMENDFVCFFTKPTNAQRYHKVPLCVAPCDEQLIFSSEPE